MGRQPPYDVPRFGVRQIFSMISQPERKAEVRDARVAQHERFLLIQDPGHLDYRAVCHPVFRFSVAVFSACGLRILAEDTSRRMPSAIQ